MQVTVTIHPAADDPAAPALPEPRLIDCPLDAAIYLLANWCTPVEVQQVRGEIGRRILNSFPVQNDG